MQPPPQINHSMTLPYVLPGLWRYAASTNSDLTIIGDAYLGLLSASDSYNSDFV